MCKFKFEKYCFPERPPSFLRYTTNVLVPGSFFEHFPQCRRAGSVDSAARSTASEVKLLSLKPAALGCREDLTSNAGELSTGPGTQQGSRSTLAILSCYCRDKSCENEVGKGSLSKALIYKKKD